MFADGHYLTQVATYNTMIYYKSTCYVSESLIAVENIE